MSKDRVAKFLEKMSKDKALRDSVADDDPQERIARALQRAREHGIEFTQDDLLAFLTAGAKKLDGPPEGHPRGRSKGKG